MREAIDTLADPHLERIFHAEEKSFTRSGYYTEAEGPEMLSLEMQRGDIKGLNDPKSVLISASFAEAVFGHKDPIGKTLRMSMEHDLTVAGVYKDIPGNSTFSNVDFFTTWEQYLLEAKWIGKMNNPWGSSSFLTHVQLKPHADMEQVNAKIRNVIYDNCSHDQDALNSEPVCFIHPMNKWKLYSRFENGKVAGGFIETVRMFALIAVFVLLLACFNFVNLSTARSEKRAREVGVRKAIGSKRQQVMGQFYSEAIMVTSLAMVLSIGLVSVSLPWFNEVANKEIQLDWGNPLYYLGALAFVGIIGLLAGSYPALYLSAFKPIEVLRGTYQAGRAASVPRKVMVLTQFALSTALIIGTMTVYKQIQHGLDRPLGYSQQ
ncbi:MAG: FtsX-like permease family protein, partial [Bacteroidota bacterium]